MKKYNRVLFASEKYNEHAKRFILSLKEKYDTVLFFCIDDIDPKQFDSRIKCIIFKPSNIFRNKEINFYIDILRVKLLVLKTNPDAIQVGPLHTLGYLFSKAGLKNLIVMSYAYDIQYCAKKSDFENKKVAHTISNSELILCDCVNLKNIIVSKYKCTEEKIRIFPWGVNINIFSPKTSKINDFQTQKKIFIHTRTIQDEIYNVTNVVNSFIEIAQINKDFQVLFLGKGEKKEELEMKVHDYKLNDLIYFLGEKKHDEIHTYFSSSDFYISASNADGSSVSLMESLACGLPALVSNTPCNKEWIIDDLNGYTFDQKRTESIKNIILQCLQMDSEKYFEMRRNARITAESKADWEKNKKILFDAHDFLDFNS